MCYEPRTSRVAAAISEQPHAAGGRNTRPVARPLGGAPDWSAAWTAAATSCAGSASMTMFRRSSTRRAACPACRGASCGPAAMSALLVEVVVHRGAVHADGLGDLGDGVLPLAVRPGSFIHAAHRGGLLGVQLGPSAASAPAGPGCVEALAGGLDDQLALELVDRAEDMADQPPSRRGRAGVLR